jgi:hypothetical protein
MTAILPYLAGWGSHAMVANGDQINRAGRLPALNGKTKMNEGYVTFFMGPGVSTDDPVENKLLRSHEAEANKQEAEFWNYGNGLAKNEIYSKTSRGHLESRIDPNTRQVSHRWVTYEEEAHRQERFTREALESTGRSVRDHALRKLRPLRQVYGDLTEFAPVWEAIDKLKPEGNA